MKILGKAFIILAILAIVLFPVAGCTGSEGPEGPAGPTGPAGSAGSTGSQGPDGAAGPQGPTGPQGTEGPAGSTGSQGPQGPSGATGPQGPVGPQGPIGPAGIQGPAGPTGPQGAMGPQGEQGPAGSVRQIVVTWDPSDPLFFGPMSALGTVEAYPGQHIRIKGSCFNPGDIIIISICEDDTVLAEAVANDCGAFEVFATLPGVPPLSYGPVSVKAWVDIDGDGIYEKQASWPLDIVYESYFKGQWYEWWSYWGGPIL